MCVVVMLVFFTFYVLFVGGVMCFACVCGALVLSDCVVIVVGFVCVSCGLYVCVVV